VGDIWLLACPGFKRNNARESISQGAALDVDSIEKGFALVA